MKSFLSFLLFVALFVSSVSAQYFPVDTARLNNAYEALMQCPQSSEKQKEFFNVFPGSWEEFNDTYRYCDKEGYDLSMYKMAHKHLKTLENCTAINDTLFCNRLIALSVGASLDADAPNYLNMLLHGEMEKNSDVFMHCLSKIGKGYQMQFWQFYWSSIVENTDDKKEYKALFSKYKRKYPQMMKRMAVAFENFNGGVLHFSSFCDFMKER